MESAETTVEILRRAQSGDPAGLRELLERYRPRLLERIRLMMGTGARRAAESGDFLQDVMLRICQNVDRFEVRDETAFLRWAVRIARNTIVDAVRRPREARFETLSVELRLVAGSGATPSREAARRDEIEHVVELLERLPPDDREVIELRHLEQLSFRAIAERMKRSENAVQLLHAKALTRLGTLARRLQ